VRVVSTSGPSSAALTVAMRCVTITNHSPSISTLGCSVAAGFL
jgi:hypothetical protein